MRILYLHDFDKEPNQALLTALNKDFIVISLKIANREFLNKAFIEQLIANQLGDRFILLGERLGAYWANYLASKLELFSVLINPCFNPQAEYKISAEPTTGLESEQFIGNYNYHGFAIGPIKQPDNQLISNDALTVQEVTALEKLNSRLTVLEKEILEDAINLEQKIQQHPVTKNNTIENYFLTVNISVRMATENKKANNWLYFHEELASGCSNNKDEFLARLAKDPNSLPSNHPLSSFKHSWLFHQLYHVWRVSFSDLLKVNSVHGKVEAVFRTAWLDFTSEE